MALELNANLRDQFVEGPWSWYWSRKAPPKVEDFVWRCLRGLLPTKARLVERGINVAVSCARCGAIKDPNYVFIVCVRLR